MNHILERTIILKRHQPRRSCFTEQPHPLKAATPTSAKVIHLYNEFDVYTVTALSCGLFCSHGN